MRGKSLLGLEYTDVSQMKEILQTASRMKEIINQEVKKVPSLKGKAVINLFFENSTRTRTSFELAGKYLGADVVNISASSSSVAKGESLRDTLLTLQSMKVDAIVMRHSAEGSAHYADGLLRNAAVINAGDGAHEHPTQGLLDIFTIQEHKKNIEGRKVAILGDIRHSRVARSNIWGLTKLGAEVHLGGPRTLIPKEIADMGVVIHDTVEGAIKNADVLNVLRIQLERQKKGLFPTPREYARIFGLNAARLKLAKDDALILHPGPMNRGLEISPEVAYGSQSAIEEQVTSGVAIRMAVLFLILSGKGEM